MSSAPAYENETAGYPADKKMAINTDVPANEAGPSSSLTAHTHSPSSAAERERVEANGAPNGSTLVSPTSATGSTHEPSKSEIKEQKKYEKMLNKDEKHEAKTLSAAQKAADKARKAEEKSLKEEGKANRQVEKSKKAEYKAKQKLIKAQNAHEKAASDLNRVQGIAASKTKHHQDMVADYKSKTAHMESFKQTKTQHDQERAAKLSGNSSA